MNNRKYPASLFIIGLITDIPFRYFWLFLPSVILLIIGIFVKPCLYIGLVLLSIDVVLSFVDQIRIRRTFQRDSDNPDFQAFQDALSKDGGWRDNLGEFINSKMNDPQNEIKSDDETESKQKVHETDT